MDTNAILDVSIGLALMYLLLSLYCTIANEFIASLFKLRALNLRRGLKKILDDGELLKAFDGTAVMKSMKRVSGRIGPSYLPPERFTEALLDALKTKGGLSESDLAKDLAGALDTLPIGADLKANLIGLARESAGKIDEFRDRTAAWFDDMMERGAGVYKRWVQLISFLIGLGLAVGLNADTIAVAKAIWSDTALRGQLVETATEIVDQTGYLEDIASFKAINEELRPFPIGWEGGLNWSTFVQSFSTQKAIGWLLTALAVSLGAPFWFDLLSKFTKLRGSGGVPPKGNGPTQTVPAQGGTR